MRLYLRHTKTILTSLIVLSILTIPQTGLAQSQSHVVPSSDIQNDMVRATRTRQGDLQKVRNLFSNESAQKALENAQIDSQQVRDAVSTLSDVELARLAARSDQLNEDFAAGRISDRDLILILVAIAVVILVIVAVD